MSVSLRPRSALALALLACGAPPPPPSAPETCPEKPLEIAITGGPRLNADGSGAGFPVQLRLYQLSSEGPLSNAFFDDLWRDDKATLGDALLDKRQLTVFPDNSETVIWPASPSAKALGAVALFREPKGRDWTISFQLDAPASTPPCPDGPRISMWLDGMKIQDGAGR